MEILYHYCSTAAFQAIVEQRAIRLSSLSLSNDALEGKLVARILERLAEQDRLQPRVIEQFARFVRISEEIVDGLGFCLSEEGDLLSQWRGYADDAKGVSIGFSRSYLEWLAGRPDSMQAGERAVNRSWGFSVERVRYDPEEQEREIKPTYQEMKKLIEAGALAETSVRGLLMSDEQAAQEDEERKRLLGHLTNRMLTLYPKLFVLKSRAFREEKEWRLVSDLVLSTPDCEFRATQDRVIPYRTYGLLELNRQPYC